MLKVIKRDGAQQDFDKNKIRVAILQAALSVGQEDFDEIAMSIADDIEQMLVDSNEKAADIEDIQNWVEVGLMDYMNAEAVAKAYILYREERRKAREKAAKYRDIIMQRAVAADEANAKANANLDENSFSGRMYEASEALWKEIALEDFMPDDIAQLHRECQLYLHDLSRFALGEHNCSTIDLAGILERGLITRQIKLRSPSRFYTACQQVAVIFQILSQCQFGK